MSQILQATTSLLLEALSPTPWSGSSLLKRLLYEGNLFSTGIPEFDQLLGGGLLAGELVEFAGGPSSGKSQVGKILNS